MAVCFSQADLILVGCTSASWLVLLMDACCWAMLVLQNPHVYIQIFLLYGLKNRQADKPLRFVLGLRE